MLVVHELVRTMRMCIDRCIGLSRLGDSDNDIKYNFSLYSLQGNNFSLNDWQPIPENILNLTGCL